MNDQYSEFRACGTVVRKFVSPKGNFAVLTLNVEETGRNGQRRDSKQEFCSFDCIDDLSTIPQGATVTVTGKVSFEALTSRNKEKVMVDGFAKYVPRLVITAMKPAVPLARTVPAKTASPSGSPAPVAAEDDIKW